MITFKRVALTAGFLALIGAGCASTDVVTETAATSPNTEPSTTVTAVIDGTTTDAQVAVAPVADAAADGTFSVTEVATHATGSDCWTTIEGTVYDVTDYVDQHPGEERILEACGVNATDLFTGKSVAGRVHSAVARATLKKYKIGIAAE